MATDRRYDVAILGSGLGGTMLAAVLARQGKRVLVLEKGKHPRFAIGESTTPSATVLLRLVGERFDVPEIASLGDFYSTRAAVGCNHGLKEGFSFLFHEEGSPQDPEHSNQLPTIAALGSDVHYFRQDTDEYMLEAAIRHGADVFQDAGEVDVDLDATPVELESSTVGKFTADFVVDGTGFRSIVAEKLGLRDQPCRFMTNTRSIFTHVTGVKPYDEISSFREHGFRYPMHESTLHHLFRDGWFWVIPFSNHGLATNEICSLGLTLDAEEHPFDPSVSGDDEFFAWVSRFPSIAAHFEGVRAVRPWISTPRIQYSSRRMHGKNWALLPHSAGFIDPLFSAGLPQTASAVYELGRCLGEDRVPDDGYDEGLSASFEIADKLVSTSYRVFQRGYSVWNAWYRVWVLGSILGPYVQVVGLSQYYATGDPSHLDRVRASPWRSLLGFGVPQLRAVLDDCASIVTNDALADEEVVAALQRRLDAVDLLIPQTGFKDFDRRGLAGYTLGMMLRVLVQQPKRLESVFPKELTRVSIGALFSHESRALFDLWRRSHAGRWERTRRLVAAP